MPAGSEDKQSVLMTTSDKPDLENLSKDELIAMVMAAAEEKKEEACAPHDSAALACLLSRLGLALHGSGAWLHHQPWRLRARI